MDVNVGFGRRRSCALVSDGYVHGCPLARGTGVSYRPPVVASGEELDNMTPVVYVAAVGPLCDGGLAIQRGMGFGAGRARIPYAIKEVGR